MSLSPRRCGPYALSSSFSLQLILCPAHFYPAHSLRSCFLFSTSFDGGSVSFYLPCLTPPAPAPLPCLAPPCPRSVCPVSHSLHCLAPGRGVHLISLLSPILNTGASATNQPMPLFPGPIVCSHLVSRSAEAVICASIATDDFASQRASWLHSQASLKALLKELRAASARSDEKRAQSVDKVLCHIYKMLSSPELDGMAPRFAVFLGEHSAQWCTMCDRSASARTSEAPASSASMLSVRGNTLTPTSLPHQIEYDFVSGRPVNAKRPKPSC